MWDVLIPAVALLLNGGPVVRLPPPQSRTSDVDLAQIQLVLPKKVQVGKTFRVLDEVENQGESGALNSLTLFYLSEDDRFDERDTLVGGRRVPQLGRRTSNSTVTPVTLKPSIAPGKYYFLAIANAKRQLEERYLDNNVRAVPILVLPATK